jgi:hypothetical protein
MLAPFGWRFGPKPNMIGFTVLEQPAARALDRSDAARHLAQPVFGEARQLIQLLLVVSELGARLGEAVRPLPERLRRCAERSLKALDDRYRIVIEGELRSLIGRWVILARLVTEGRCKNDIVRRPDRRHGDADFQARHVAKPDRRTLFYQSGPPLAQFSQQCGAGGGAVGKAQGLTAAHDHDLGRGNLGFSPALRPRQILFRGADPVAGIVNRFLKKAAMIVMGAFLCPEPTLLLVQRLQLAVRIKEGELVRMAAAAAGGARWPARRRTGH